MVGRTGGIGHALSLQLTAQDANVIVAGWAFHDWVRTRRAGTGEGIERDLAVSDLGRFVIVNRIGSRLSRDRARRNMRAHLFIVGLPGSN